MRAFDPASALTLCVALLVSVHAHAADKDLAARLRYQLDPSLDRETLEAEASGLARHFDWLTAHGYRLRLNGSVSQPEHPPRCGWVDIEFAGPVEAQELLLKPLLLAFGVAVNATSIVAASPSALIAPAPAGSANVSLLKPTSNLAELLGLLGTTARCGLEP